MNTSDPAVTAFTLGQAFLQRFEFHSGLTACAAVLGAQKGKVKSITTIDDPGSGSAMKFSGDIWLRYIQVSYEEPEITDRVAAFEIGCTENGIEQEFGFSHFITLRISELEIGNESGSRFECEVFPVCEDDGKWDDVFGVSSAETARTIGALFLAWADFMEKANWAELRH